MNVAFYAPLKAPDHPVPSGDRTMARALLKALGQAGGRVTQPSRFRSFLSAPNASDQGELRARADREVDRIAAGWARDGVPDAWFTYHNHYKAPDLLGPVLTRRFGLPYAVAEASHAPKRAAEWTSWNSLADDASRAADLHLCFTARDRLGIAQIARQDATLVDVPPFIDLEGVGPVPARLPDAVLQLLAVAMMRPGDKLESYRFLGEALLLLRPQTWHLTIVGDGPARDDVARAFAPLPASRLTWRGELQHADLSHLMAAADLFVWPGFGEAFGLAYLEAQAAGLPVLALETAGVSSVVAGGRTGMLVAEPKPARYAEALEFLMGDRRLVARMGREAARFVRLERSLDCAAENIGHHLRTLIGNGSPAHA